jgi:deoxyribodipyrimidine photo-lyase
MLDKLGKENGVIRQLFWRDFFYHLSNANPEIYTHALNPKYRVIHWKKNPVGWRAWCEGRTGFPVVDACMRELNTTGYMHNRGRLIVSSFLCRMLHIDWRDGERYFATQLYDYDPAQNNFGWQVSGANSSGTTSRPLEQTILNPWIQSAQFDPKGEYIKKWCPELNDVLPADLHRWHERSKLWLDKGVKYIAPILDYKTEKENNLKMYRKYLK